MTVLMILQMFSPNIPPIFYYDNLQTNKRFKGFLQQTPIYPPPRVHNYFTIFLYFFLSVYLSIHPSVHLFLMHDKVNCRYTRRALSL